MSLEYDIVKLEKRIMILELDLRETRAILSRALDYMPISPVGLRKLQSRLEQQDGNLERLK